MADEKRASPGADDPVGTARPAGTGPRGGAGLRLLHALDIAAELRRDAAFGTDGRLARTVIHDGPARIVVSVVDVGRVIGGETSDGHVAILVLEGEGALDRGDDSTALSPGTVAVLKPGEGWSLRAATPFACVACFWQPGP
jgi:quercetin dioxygenase-like cupin family protein